jgi:hypothetical protein
MSYISKYKFGIYLLPHQKTLQEIGSKQHYGVAFSTNFTAKCFNMHKMMLYVNEFNFDLYINIMIKISTMVTEIHLSIKQLTGLQKDITFLWVPSHCRFVGNEMANLAK